MSESSKTKFIFGIPYHKAKIDSTAYDKAKIVQIIENNYKIDPKRNRWDQVSNLHHLNGDEYNPSFVQIETKLQNQLLKLYKEEIQSFFNSHVTKEAAFGFHIVNYTCMQGQQYMFEHVHPCDFSAVHYLKFNKSAHIPTQYFNPSVWAQYNDLLFSGKWQDLIEKDNLNHSWMRATIDLKVDEDDFVITPGPLKHFVPASNSEELRMTVIVNIKFG